MWMVLGGLFRVDWGMAGRVASRVEDELWFELCWSCCVGGSGLGWSSCLILGAVRLLVRSSFNKIEAIRARDGTRFRLRSTREIVSASPLYRYTMYVFVLWRMVFQQ